jgi:murein DD-endopeptidase MepM/ murein hydrolase activator NlpD
VADKVNVMKGASMMRKSGTQMLKVISLAVSIAALAVLGIVATSNSAEAASSTDLTFALPTSTSPFSNCGYNVKTCANKTKYHTGIDYRGSSSGTTPAKASNYGIVARVENMSINDCGMGNNIILEHELSSGGKIYTSYSHLASFAAGLRMGDFVLKGQTLGIVGRSGNGNANAWDDTHVHFEVKTKGVPGNPSGSGSYCGYTPGNPTDYGYKNPQLYLGTESVKPPVAII